MAFTFTFPTAAEMQRIDADLMAEEASAFEGQKLFPTQTANTFDVRWYQEDNVYGYMAFRGLGGRPSKVQRVGTNLYHYEPGAFGTFCEIDETEVTRRMAYTNPSAPIPMAQLFEQNQRLLVQQELNRMETMIWTLLETGTISIPMNGPAGITIYQDTYPIQTFACNPTWGNTSTAHPLADLHQIQQLFVGHSVDFGPASTLYVNQVTANNLMFNSNASDLFAFRNQFGATVMNDLGVLNQFFAGRGLPQIKVYDRFYQTIPLPGVNTSPSLGYNVQKFIPNGYAVLVGKRSNGAPMGRFQQTINAVNPKRASGPYSFINDYFNAINATREIPGRIEQHRGFNGGLALHYPSGIVAIQC